MKNCTLKLIFVLFTLYACSSFADRGRYPSQQGAKVVHFPFGLEFEFATEFSQNATINTVPKVSGVETPISIFEKPLKILKEVMNEGGDIKIDDWDKYPEKGLKYAHWTDRLGRKWISEPEWVHFAMPDGVEFVTPVLETDEDLKIIKKFMEKLVEDGDYGKGYRSATHATFGVKSLIKEDGKAPMLVNLILNCEENLLNIYNALTPSRYGGIINRFGIPLSLDYPELFVEISTLARKDQTMPKLKEIFSKYLDKELDLFSDQPDPMVKAFKYRAINYKKLFGLAGIDQVLALEFRMLDMNNPDKTIKDVKYLQSFLKKATTRRQGRFKNPWGRKRRRGGEEYKVFDELIFSHNKLDYQTHLEGLGLKIKNYPNVSSQYKTLSYLPTLKKAQELARVDSSIPIEIKGKKMTFGFELEFKADRNSELMGGNANAPDYEKFPFLDPRGTHFEGSGNLEIISKPTENLDKLLQQMKSVKRAARSSTGVNARGFHLHMRFPKSAITEIGGRENFHAWISRVSDYLVAHRLDTKKTFFSLKAWSQVSLNPQLANARGTMRVQSFGDWADVEIRGGMTDIHIIEDITKVIVAGIQNPKLVHGFYLEQREQFNSSSAISIFEEIKTFVKKYFKRDLTTNEKSLLTSIYNEIGAKSHLPLAGIEYIPYMSQLERKKFQEAKIKFLWNVKNYVIERYSEDSSMYGKAREAYRHQIRKWGREVNLKSTLRRSLLLVLPVNHKLSDAEYITHYAKRGVLTNSLESKQILKSFSQGKILEAAKSSLIQKEIDYLLINVFSNASENFKNQLRRVKTPASCSRVTREFFLL